MKRKQLWGVLLVVLLVLVLFVLAGYGSGGVKNSMPGAGREDTALGAPASYYDKSAVESGRGRADGSYSGAEQKLIRTASISLDVENLDMSLQEITAAVRKAEGFVAESNLHGPAGNRLAYLTLRIPAARLDSLLAELETLGKRTEKSTGSSDVTLQYVDLEARIRNLERQEERLLAILDKADVVEDVLRVEQELARVRGQLESMTAEFRYLRDRVDYAAIHVSLRETPTASPTITGSGLRGVWQRGTAGLVNSINAMLTGLGNMMVALMSALPYLFIIALLAVPVYLMVRRFAGPRTPGA